MTVKEKARAYDKALERARVYHTGGSISDVHITEVIFPELRKSENDRIREDLIQWIDDFPDSIWRGHNKKNIIAWLEKQGQTFTKKDVDDAYLKGIYDAKHEIEKQGEKPTDKVEPKFKVGDWVIDNIGNIYQIETAAEIIAEHIFGYTIVGGGYFNDNNDVHLWTLQDAKDGDVLAFDNDTIVIFENLYNNSTFHSYCHIENGLFEVSKDDMPDWWEGKGFQPATKGQRDLLFAKMNEAGYEWDGEKKEVKKIVPKFKVGDWIVGDEGIFKITQYEDEYGYELTGTTGYVAHFVSSDYVESNFHLWTIADAKDGDVLAYVTDEEDLWIMIYRSLYEPYEGHVHYHALLVNDNFSDKGTCCICIDNLKPATKEQRDLLFQKMKEAGYEWDDDRKELKKIEVASKESEDERVRKGLIKAFGSIGKKDWGGLIVRDILAWLEKQGEQKTAVYGHKFRVGDIVKSKSRPMLDARKIISIDKDCYWCEDKECLGFAWEDDYELAEQKGEND